MVTAAAPLRLSLAGGGSDLPEYYVRHGCHLLAAALDLDVRVTVTEIPEGIVVSDSGLAWDLAMTGGEPPAIPVARVSRTAELPPSLVRCALDRNRIDSGVRVDIQTTCPPGTGLGWSGALAVALAAAAAAWRGKPVSAPEAAEAGFRMERFELGRSVGQQDHWVAALGGVTRLQITPSGKAAATREPALEDALAPLLDRSLLLFRTPIRRSADKILAHQARRLSGWRANTGAVTGLQAITAMVPAVESALAAGRVSELGTLLHEHWTAKVKASPMASSPAIDEWYTAARAAGAIGGKIVGAGGGGHLLVACPPERAGDIDAVLVAAGLTRVPARLRRHGLIVSGPGAPEGGG
jgi:D-glycero-alpha-D-manno-heptose-7-phosphate kinase